MTNITRLFEECAAIAREHAVKVDAQGSFPEEAIAALAQRGLLGLLSATDVGGLGQGLRQAAHGVRLLAQACASTAMVTCMHYSATAVIEKHGPKTVREAIAKGAHLSTLAFSEVGSRSQFWAPVSSARRDGNDVVLDAEKSFVTSASRATAYVWSSRPLEGEGASTLWLVPRAANGLQVARPFDGLGLRGNDSAPVTARGTRVAESARLGDEGGGFGVMMGIVLPFFNVMNAATSVGLMQEATRLVAAHAGRTKFENQGSALCDLPTIRAQIAKMQVRTDMAFALWQDTLDAIEGGRPEAQLRVLESKAACNDAANEVLDVALRVTGGAGYRKDLPIERLFRDARAGSVMGPTADVLYEFIGRAVTGLPLF